MTAPHDSMPSVRWEPRLASDSRSSARYANFASMAPLAIGTTVVSARSEQLFDLRSNPQIRGLDGAFEHGYRLLGGWQLPAATAHHGHLILAPCPIFRESGGEVPD